jgi:hypothetical protein
MAIGTIWPIPIHWNCRCQQRIVPIGGPAPQPFADFRRILDEMPPAQQREAVGASVYRLLEAGKIRWEDAVSRYRVNTLQEVVATRKLSIETMTKAGVKPAIAKAAHAAAHTPAQEAVRALRTEALAYLESAGVPHQALVEELSRAMTARAGIAGGIRPETLAPFARASEAERMARLLAAWRPGMAVAAGVTEEEIRRSWERHQKDPANPRMTLAEFKRALKGT